MSNPEPIGDIVDRLNITPKRKWGWSGARRARLSDSGPFDAVNKSRASRTEGGPRLRKLKRARK